MQIQVDFKQMIAVQNETMVFFWNCSNGETFFETPGSFPFVSLSLLVRNSSHE